MKLNKTISNNAKKWSIITDFQSNPGSLRHYCNLIKKDGLHLEP